MPGRLQGKVAIITGSSSGIGRATSLTFAREGASMVCSDLREAARQEAENEPTHEIIKKNGGKVIFVKCDTSKEADVEALLQAGVEEFGRVDIMVNNAGIALETDKGPKSIWDVYEEMWDTTMAVNAKGVMLGCKHAARVMMNQEPHPSGDRGSIINLSSIFGLVGNAGTVCYNASKHAVAGITKCAAMDLAPYRVHVNAICPGYAVSAMTERIWEDKETEQRLTAKHPFRGIGRPQDIANAALFLASDDNTWMTGACVSVDGGYTAI